MMKQPVRTNVSDLIKTTMGSQFVIPVYQRSYTWRPEAETARLMNDIEGLLQDKNRIHFLGILICLEQKAGSMHKEIQIVDGQQRLTTSFLFLLALRQAALEKKDKDTAGLVDDYYLYNAHADEDAHMRLKPAVASDDTFARLYYGSYQDLDRSEKETNVYRNFEFILQRLHALSRKYDLREILDTLSRLDILVFPLSESDNAQQIFESINSTGEPLTSADMIRNYILMNDASEVQERNYRLYWQPLEKRIPDPHRLEEFFRYYLAAKTFSLSSRRDTYEAFKSWWNSSSLSKEEKMRSINSYSRYYDEIYKGPSENETIEAALHDFRYNESRVPAPFFMEMFRLYGEGKLSARDLAGIIRLIDTYLTRRALLGLDTSALGRYFPQLLRSVLTSYQQRHANLLELTKLHLVNYNRGKALAMPTDRQLQTALKETNAYALMCIRPVLERIEHYGATAQVDTSHLNIEHIMPQHPNGWWRKHAGVKDEEEYTFYANLIGNLTLCAEYDNTRIGNEDFAYKKKILSQTLHIRMNTEILEKETWGAKEILARCETMTAQILAIYPYQSAHNVPAARPARRQAVKEDVLVLSTPSVNARAVDHGEKGVEILSGSSMRPYSAHEMKAMQSRYRNLLDQGVIYEDENGTVQFARNCRLPSLNTAAQFLLHRGGDNLEAWTYENGAPLKPQEEKKPAKQKPAARSPQPPRTEVKKAAAKKETKKRTTPVKKAAARPEKKADVEVRHITARKKKAAPALQPQKETAQEKTQRQEAKEKGSASLLMRLFGKQKSDR
jgi:uncharacterized protein with ParB-like and HNH nuclease domain